jgi:hypothetical protein
MPFVSASIESREATTTVRKLASQLRSSLVIIPCYDALASNGWVRNRDAVMGASRELIGWSNEIWGGDGRNLHAKKIAELLNIEI